LFTLDKPLVQKIYKFKKSRDGKALLSKKAIGVLTAGIDPTDSGKVIIGWSLCHRNDQFDYVQINGGKRKYVPHLGTYKSFRRAKHLSNVNMIECPHSIRTDFVKFLNRCSAYYKDREFPFWTKNIVYKKEALSEIAKELEFLQSDLNTFIVSIPIRDTKE